LRENNNFSAAFLHQKSRMHWLNDILWSDRIMWRVKPVQTHLETDKKCCDSARV